MSGERIKIVPTKAEVIRYEQYDNELWAIMQLPDGDRIRVLVVDATGDVQW